ncbi:MAG: ECF transporter S component [Lachnospiraceae bacterium]|nr:ECF transporter S component [Lachnospiraceae bacterium]MBR3734379.1 ECF transporter S component [Lachnospiraceae bacterium]
MNKKNDLKRFTPKQMTITSIFMAMTIILSMSIFSITVPGGHLYFVDAVICTGAILLGDPVLAFIMGGFGSFLGDMIFYPAPMFVSLFTHGIQAAVIALCASRLFQKGSLHEKHPSVAAFAARLTGVLIGAVIMVIGYTLGRAYVYATPAESIAKLPFEIVQALFGVVVSLSLTAPSSAISHAFRRYAH